MGNCVTFALTINNNKKISIMKNQNGFYNINNIVNANATEMVDGSKWIKWSLNQLKKGLPKRNLNKIAALITD
jgi:hypothetical protein